MAEKRGIIRRNGNCELSRREIPPARSLWLLWISGRETARALLTLQFLLVLPAGRILRYLRQKLQQLLHQSVFPSLRNDTDIINYRIRCWDREEREGQRINSPFLRFSTIKSAPPFAGWMKRGRQTAEKFPYRFVENFGNWKERDLTVFSQLSGVSTLNTRI